MKNILEKAKTIKKNSLETQYQYKYFFIDGDKITPVEKDPSRETFEKFRKDTGFSFDYPGKVSYREFFKDNELKGFVLEDKVKKKTQYSEDIKKLYEEAFAYIVKELDIQDVDNFEYFLENENFFDFDLNMSNVTFYVNKINFLNDILRRYNSDKDFKQYLDKIIK